MWDAIEQELIDEVESITVGPAEDFTNFMSAVIDRRSFDKIQGYIERARARKTCTVLVGGGCDDATGYFVEPTIILTEDPHSEAMVEEIFGPVLTIHVYEDEAFEEVLDLCDRSSPYALTGSIFSDDEAIIDLAFRKSFHGWKFLHQRQTDRFSRRPATLRWGPCKWNQRQGRESTQPDALDLATSGEAERRTTSCMAILEHG